MKNASAKRYSVTFALAALSGLAMVYALKRRRSALPTPADANKMVLSYPANRSKIDEAVGRVLAAASEQGWLSELGEHVVIKPAFFPDSVNTGLSSDPALVRALARALHSLKAGLQIDLLVAEAHGLAADDWLDLLGLAEVAKQERLDVVHLSSEPAFWSYASELPWPLPLPAVALEDAFFISLGQLSLHPLERMIGILYHHAGCLPGIWGEQWENRRHAAMAWAAQLYPPNLCVLDGRTVPAWVGQNPSGCLESDVLLCAPDPISVDIAAARLLKIEPIQVLALRAARRVASKWPSVQLAGISECEQIAPAAGRPYYEARTLKILDRLPLTLGQREQWRKKLTGSREPLTYLIPRVWHQLDAVLAYWWGWER